MFTIQSIKKSESFASELISAFNITTPPIPIETIVKKVGLKISIYNFDDGISGALVISKGKGTIGVNKTDNDFRKRFTIAHELGHFIMHKDSSELFLDKDFLVKWRNTTSNSNYSMDEKIQELEANAFAAALLMPKHLLENEMAKGEFKSLSEIDLFQQLADKFQVSVPAMSFRLSNINSYFI